jgi:hypothetical protein
MQVLLYAVINNVQASYDEALRLACKSLHYPLGQGRRSTIEVFPDSTSTGNWFTVIGNFLASMFGRSSAGSTGNRISPLTSNPFARGHLDLNNWKQKRLLRQTLAERDLVVKRAVYDLAIPELQTNLMAQMVDSNNDNVLVMEVGELARSCKVDVSLCASVLIRLWLCWRVEMHCSNDVLLRVLTCELNHVLCRTFETTAFSRGWGSSY